MTSIYHIVSESTRYRFGSTTENHDLIIRRILHVKAVTPDWDNTDWVFRVVLDSEKYVLHIRTPMNASGEEWQNLVREKYHKPDHPDADRDEELAKELFSYKIACNKRKYLMEAIDAFYTKRRAPVEEPKEVAA